MATFKVLAVAIALIGICAGQATFKNPLDDLIWQDPASIIHVGNKYYMLVCDHPGKSEIQIYESDYLSNFRNAKRTSFYPLGTPGEGETPPLVWAPKAHILNGELWMYIGIMNENNLWKTFALKAANASDPTKGWSAPIRMLADWQEDALVMDGTVMHHGGKDYFLFSSMLLGPKAVFIAEMTGPTEVKRPIVLLKYPTEDFECDGRCTSEAPHFIYNNGVSYAILTTSGPRHILTQISITEDKDPMDPNNWDFLGRPVFVENRLEKVFNVGHACFTDSPDGTETWMLFAGNLDADVLISSIRIEKIDWSRAGTPVFPLAHGDNSSMPVPSGEIH